ncbi:Histo-blood group ABO system transferase 1 [Platysternon megacephalum]|uniref:Histo-blood group ABO system transferase 1 n=1 Tax=Platysternon megacephalum TaxID=55544 RepID=A0A4D9DQC0_9SAUR|nr:Histo-blood group ABO system transferase 1 [Platysternon megacephalum]
MRIRKVHLLVLILMAGIIVYFGQADLDETSSVLPRMSYPQPFVDKPQRTDVLLMSPWLAPIVWEDTFNRDILNAQYRQKHFIVGVATFAVKKYDFPCTIQDL